MHSPITGLCHVYPWGWTLPEHCGNCQMLFLILQWFSANWTQLLIKNPLRTVSANVLQDCPCHQLSNVRVPITADVSGRKNTCIYYGINNQKFCNKYHYSTKFSCLTFVLLIFCSSSKCVVQIWWIVAKLREISIDVEDSTDVGGSATFCKRNQTVNKAT